MHGRMRSCRFTPPPVHGREEILANKIETRCDHGLHVDAALQESLAPTDSYSALCKQVQIANDAKDG